MPRRSSHPVRRGSVVPQSKSKYYHQRVKEDPSPWGKGVKLFMEVQHQKGTDCVVNIAIVMATARGVVSHDSNLLAENGSHIDI